MFHDRHGPAAIRIHEACANAPIVRDYRKSPGSATSGSCCPEGSRPARQRLNQVVIVAIDNGGVERRLRQLLGRREAAE
jgi:hypothetical protein